MEFDLTTFLLEIVNFLVLIWILQRLFYRPVRDQINRRKQLIDQSLAQAEKMRQEALDLKKTYENRQQQWDQEKQAAISALHQQLETDRQQQLLKLREELEQERHRARTSMQRQQQEIHRHQQKLALLNGAHFASLILKQAAGPQLEDRLFDLLFQQIHQLPDACMNSLHTLDRNKTLDIHVSSVYPIDHERRQRLEQRLTSLIDNPLHFEYSQNPDLLAGFRIDIGAWVLHVNLQHELSGFAEIADDF